MKKPKNETLEAKPDAEKEEPDVEEKKADGNKPDGKKSRIDRKKQAQIKKIEERLSEIDAKIAAAAKERGAKIHEIEAEQRQAVSEATKAATNRVGNANEDYQKKKKKALDRKNAAIRNAERAYDREFGEARAEMRAVQATAESELTVRTQRLQAVADGQTKKVDAENDKALAPVLEERKALVDELWELKGKTPKKKEQPQGPLVDPEVAEASRQTA